MNRMLSRLPYTVRTKEQHFEHLHSGSTRTNYKSYYNNKNLYDGELPVTPMTMRLNNSHLADRLYQWVLPRMKYPIELKQHEILSTVNPKNGKNIYDVRFRNANGEQYFGVVESLLWLSL